MSAEKRLHVDWTSCEGAGLCHELLPELMEEDPWGYPMPRRDRTAPGGRDVLVPGSLVGHAQRAVRTCPRLALSLQRV
ncbi:MAG TPA: ferredoxin [Actinomycetes bacterium]|nr:ferredoxin [Actinomycetes bacterium]